jgi:hypothetical protein
VYCRELVLPSETVEAAEALAEELHQTEPGDSAWAGFPRHYAFRHRDGTFAEDTGDCIAFLEHLSLLKQEETPLSMKDLVKAWAPLSETLELSSTCTFFNFGSLIEKFLLSSKKVNAFTRVHHNGDYLITENHVNRELFLVLSGSCNLAKNWQRFGVASEGNCFGELGFVQSYRSHGKNDGIAHASVTAAGKVVCLQFEASDAVACAKESSDFAFLFIMLMRILVENTRRFQFQLSQEEGSKTVDLFYDLIEELEPFALILHKAHL